MANESLLLHQNPLQTSETLNDLFFEFNSIKLYQYYIEKIKGSGNVEQIEEQFNNCRAKLVSAIKFVVFLMKQRYWFMKSMQDDEEMILKKVNELSDVKGQTSIQQQDDNAAMEKFFALESCLKRIQANFYQANLSLYSFDKDIWFNKDWKNRVRFEFKNAKRNLEEILSQDLRQGCQLFYQDMKGRLNKFRQLSGVKDDEHKINMKDLTEQQIEKIIELTETFIAQLQVAIPLQMKVLSHLWIEDFLVIQAKYEENITLESTFFSNFKGAYDQIVLYIQKSFYRLQHFDNQRIFDKMKLIKLPSENQDVNLEIHNQCAQWLFKNKEQLMKIRKHLIDLCKAQIKIKMIKLLKSQSQNQSETKINQSQIEELQPKYQGPLLLVVQDENVLYNLRVTQAKKLFEFIELIEEKIGGIEIILVKLKALWVCEKKLRKGLKYYDEVTKDYLDYKKKFNFEEKEIQETAQFVEEGYALIDKTKKLQKYLNWMSLFLGQMEDLQHYIPLIGDYIVLVERFFGRGNLLVEQISQSTLLKIKMVEKKLVKNNVYYKKNEEQSYSGKLSKFEESRIKLTSQDDSKAKLTSLDEDIQQIQNLGNGQINESNFLDDLDDSRIHDAEDLEMIVPALQIIELEVIQPSQEVYIDPENLNEEENVKKDFDEEEGNKRYYMNLLIFQVIRMNDYIFYIKIWISLNGCHNLGTRTFHSQQRKLFLWF